MKSTVAFLTGVYAVTWILCLVLRPAAEQGGLTTLLAWLLPTVWAPTLLALVIALLSTGMAGVKEELGRLRVGRGFGRWMFIAMVVPPLITATAVWSGRAVGDAAPLIPSSAILMMVIFQLITGALGEELGWRGFLLPRLGTRMGATAAAWLMAVLWSAWHIPAFFFPGTPQHALIPPVPFLMFIALFGFCLAFLFRRAGGSILPTIVAHLALNVSLGAGGVQLSSPTFWWAMVGMSAICALLATRAGVSPDA